MTPLSTQTSQNQDAINNPFALIADNPVGNHNKESLYQAYSDSPSQAQPYNPTSIPRTLYGYIPLENPFTPYDRLRRTRTIAGLLCRIILYTYGMFFLIASLIGGILTNTPLLIQAITLFITGIASIILLLLTLVLRKKFMFRAWLRISISGGTLLISFLLLVILELFNPAQSLADIFTNIIFCLYGLLTMLVALL